MTESPKSTDLADLDPEFVGRLQRMLDALLQAGTPFRVIEGWRTAERQQWLYSQGRTIPGPGVSDQFPLGRTVTMRDGVRVLSNHQGTGQQGSGRATDLWPVNGAGGVFCPVATDPLWEILAEAAEFQGLASGLRWHQRDADHVELPA